MNHKIRNVGIVCAAAATVLIVANAQDFFDDHKKTEHLLQREGLNPVDISIHDVNSTFTATVSGDTECTVSGMTDATDGAWMLTGFDPDWYPRSEYKYSDPGIPKWPPTNVSVAQVALQHPQICGIG